LHIDGGSEHVIDIVNAPVSLRALVSPGAEDGISSHDELFARVLGKVPPHVLLNNFLVFLNHFLQSPGIQLRVELSLLLFLLFLEDFVESEFGNFKNDIPEHLDETSVRIVSKPGIVASPGQRFHALIVEPEVEDSVHHSRHGELCPGAYADQ